MKAVPRIYVLILLAGLLALWVLLHPERPGRSLFASAPDLSAELVAPTQKKKTQPAFDPQATVDEGDRLNAVDDEVLAAFDWGEPASEPPAQVTAAPVAPVEPPKPTAPPMPFHYLGRYDDGSKTLFILNDGERVVNVKPGDDIDSTYRFEKIDNQQLVILYKPLNLTQTLSMEVAR
jgi:hypothetical protein